jgi:hypothetical protein
VLQRFFPLALACQDAAQETPHLRWHVSHLGPCCATERRRRALWDRPIDRVVAHIGIQIQIILAPNRIEPRGAAEAAL